MATMQKIVLKHSGPYCGKHGNVLYGVLQYSATASKLQCNCAVLHSNLVPRWRMIRAFSGRRYFITIVQVQYLLTSEADIETHADNENY